MIREEALKLLEFHSFRHEEVDHPKMETGSLGILRPVSGTLHEENFHKMMRILWALRDEEP